MNSRLDELYPEHAKTLNHTGIAPPISSQMKEVISEMKLKTTQKIIITKRRERHQETFTFVLVSVILRKVQSPFT